MIKKSKEIKIKKSVKVKEIKKCLFCEKKGTIFYKDIQDRYFNAPGLWSFFRCKNCKFIWLNPRPLQKEMKKIYSEYYTHGSVASEKSTLRNKIKMSLVAAAFKSKKNLKIKYSSWLRIIFKLNPFLKEIFGKRVVMYLQDSAGGKLLDVGCGSGNFLSIMRDLGWKVQGVEFDKKAAEIVQKRLGVKVFCKNFEKISFPKNSFDAVTMRHVIEHTEDPIRFLKKAWFILKPGGKLIVVTPNIESLGHSIFKKNWVHLDPPRHLFLFSAKSLRRCAQISGLRNPKIKVVPAAGEITYKTSQEIKKKAKAEGFSNLFRNITGLLFQLFEIFLSIFQPRIGEELVLEVVKEK